MIVDGNQHGTGFVRYVYMTAVGFLRNIKIRPGE
jgi:hypothetical protein